MCKLHVYMRLMLISGKCIVTESMLTGKPGFALPIAIVAICAEK